MGSRLFEIIYILMDRGTVTASELAKRFEVSVRTVYRDIDKLSSAGVPVFCTRGKRGGVCLMSNFVLNRSLLSEQEQNEILFALQSLSAVQGNETYILQRLNEFFCRKTPDWISVDFSHWGNHIQEKERFRLLKSGILEHRVLSFLYYNSMQEVSKRKVEPFRLCFKGNSWYLQAFCLEKQEFRTFKVSRMDKVELLEKTFIPYRTYPPEIEAVSKDSSSLIPIILRFSEKMAYRIFDEFDREQIVTETNGSFLVKVSWPDGEWIYSYLLSYQGEVQVVEPVKIRRELCSRVEKMKKIYLS